MILNVYLKKKYILILFLILSSLILPISINNNVDIKLFRRVRYFLYALPQRNERKICDSLQSRIKNILSNLNGLWSITILNSSGQVIADINGSVPRIPASNLKLLSTAYALDKLGPGYKLDTTLFVRNDGVYELYGNGDPDFNVKSINDIINYSISNQESQGRQSNLKFILYEEPQSIWWPSNWLSEDKLESYGAPITRLAITSNSFNKAIINPVRELSSFLIQSSNTNGYNSSVTSVEPHYFSRRRSKVIKKFSSAPLYALLSLANSESHNFTSEVLLRKASNSWSNNIAVKHLISWLKKNKIPIEGFSISDGSGLSPKNRLTTFGITRLLYRMNIHRFSEVYKSSFSVLGIRGTLSNSYKNADLVGRFIGKSGTLTGVKSLSGIVKFKDDQRYISILSNNAISPDQHILNILKESSKFNQCS